MNFNSSQIKNLRAEGHRLKLKPVVTIGQNGLGENVNKEIDGALSHHELLKIRIPGSGKSEKKQLSEKICKQHQAQLVQSIGGVIVIYRQNIETNKFAKFL